MKSIILTLFILIIPSVCFAEDFQKRSDWKHFFIEQGVEGTIVVIDERINAHWVYNKERAQKRFSPASTFKILNSFDLIIDDYLKIFNSNQRRNIKRERNILEKQDIFVKMVTGRNIPRSFFSVMYSPLA